MEIRFSFGGKTVEIQKRRRRTKKSFSHNIYLECSFMHKTIKLKKGKPPSVLILLRRLRPPKRPSCLALIKRRFIKKFFNTLRDWHLVKKVPPMRV